MQETYYIMVNKNLDIINDQLNINRIIKSHIIHYCICKSVLELMNEINTFR